MKRKGKTPLIVLLVLVCVAFAGFAAMFVVDGMINFVSNHKDGQVQILELLYNHWFGTGKGDGILYNFTHFTPDANNQLWFFTYINIGVCAIILALIVIGIVVAVKNKQKAKIWYIIPMLLGAIVIVDTVSNYNMYYDAVKAICLKKTTADMVFHMGTNPNGGTYQALWAFIGACCIIVFVVLLFVVYGMGLHYIRKNPNTVPAIEEKPAEEPVEEVKEEEPVEEQPVEGEYAMASVNTEEPVVSEEVEEPEIEIEPVEDFAPIVEVEPVQEEVKAEEPVEEVKKPAEEPAPAPALDEAKLAGLLKDLVRDIVRDEIARSNLNQPQQPQQPSNITGATFGGPLVVQYFNGGIQGVPPTPCCAPAPAPVAEPAPAPVQEPAPAPAPVADAKPEVKAEVKPEAPAEKKVIERIPFPERLLAADKELKDIYSELKNELLSWGVKSRVSNTGDTFRLHTKTYAKITVAGKSLKFHFALDPKDYKDSTIPVSDAGDKNLYVDIPLVFKVKSGLSVKRCKQLIQECCEKDGLEQGEVLSVNWIKELKASIK